MSYMFEEIQEQPEAVRRTVQGERTRLARVAEEIRRRDPILVVIAARGTSDNAATYAKYLWGIGNGLPETGLIIGIGLQSVEFLIGELHLHGCLTGPGKRYLNDGCACVATEEV